MRWVLILLLLTALTPFKVAQAQTDDPWAEDPWAEEEWAEDDWDDEAGKGPAFNGFVEAAFGTRFESDPLIDDRATLGELRWRVESDFNFSKSELTVKADALYDAVLSEWDLDVRDLSLSFGAGGSTDFRIGRQVQTWGTGDLLFLNDLFPKDYESFFAGRDDEYLKAPGNALRVSHFSSAVNMDFVWTPVFEPDVYLDGERFSFYFPPAGGNIAPDPPFDALEPDHTLANGEFALRLFGTRESREWAVYAYHGFWKQPNALTESLQPTFAPLNALGASLRQPLGPGLFNAEFAWYDSEDDRSGSDPLTPNSQWRMLGGYEWEARANFTVGLQYYLEWTLDYDELLANSPFPQIEPDEFRHVFTNRLTWRSTLGKQTWSLFSFYSPSDDDFYLRPVFTYRYSDAWSMTAGANLFGGRDDHTFFNQLQDASNAYLRLRYHY